MTHRTFAQLRAEFIRQFNALAQHKRRYEVFRDFVTLSAISLNNVMEPDAERKAALESEYMGIIRAYSHEQAHGFAELLGLVVNMLEHTPQDVLGELYMELDLGNERAGQFFTPNTISQFMARLNGVEPPPGQNFVRVCEPACGAGGMVLAIAQALIENGKNPARAMWAQCQDIDRTAALMCFIQLSLWNIPAVVIVGDTLANEVRECFYTPAHYMGAWDYRLAWADSRDRQGAKPEEATADQSESFTPEEPVQMRWIF
ncbi:N-6 DNA methylase [Limnohabitans sp.]|uniref:N-6 DNA methylase n=1 Tax=Limnohabitans sp. TaxID=1907725 RepID=UPI0035B25E15